MDLRKVDHVAVQDDFRAAQFGNRVKKTCKLGAGVLIEIFQLTLATDAKMKIAENKTWFAAHADSENPASRDAPSGMRCLCRRIRLLQNMF